MNAKQPPADDASHLLVVDDDIRIRNLLERYLRDQGFRITVAETAADARRKLDGLEFDLIVADIMMPGEDGVSLTHSLKETRNIPVILLTALSESASRIEGLEAGADDYIAKPFDPRELVLRIRNILRRTENTDSLKIEQVVFGPFTYSLAKRELKRGTDVVRLTEREHDIMHAFASNPGETVPRLELSDTEAGERSIDVQINRLRRKIEDDPANPVWLQTVRGIGYRLSIE